MNAHRLPAGTVCIKPNHIRIRFSDDKVTTCFLSTTLSQYLNMVKKDCQFISEKPCPNCNEMGIRATLYRLFACWN